MSVDFFLRFQKNQHLLDAELPCTWGQETHISSRPSHVVGVPVSSPASRCSRMDLCCSLSFSPLCDLSLTVLWWSSLLDQIHLLPRLAPSMDRVNSMWLCPPCLGAVGWHPVTEGMACPGCALDPGSPSLQAQPACVAP